jgi:hypothetical protein
MDSHIILEAYSFLRFGTVAGLSKAPDTANHRAFPFIITAAALPIEENER